jgi:hypothetical protein
MAAQIRTFEQRKHSSKLKMKNEKKKSQPGSHGPLAETFKNKAPF